MDSFGFDTFEKRDIKELEITPILDMLVAVIFFLLLSTTFVDLTKLTLPPSGTTTISDPVAPPPVSAQFMGVYEQGAYRLLLRWTGAQPGQIYKTYNERPNRKENREGLLEVIKEMTAEYLVLYPSEKTMQLGLSRNMAYQGLITIMDGISEKIPDIVLFSYNEAEAKMRFSQRKNTYVPKLGGE